MLKALQWPQLANDSHTCSTPCSAQTDDDAYIVPAMVPYLRGLCMQPSCHHEKLYIGKEVNSFLKHPQHNCHACTTLTFEARPYCLFIITCGVTQCHIEGMQVTNREVRHDDVVLGFPQYLHDSMFRQTGLATYPAFMGGGGYVVSQVCVQISFLRQSPGSGYVHH